jgi:hypothetical protein
LVPAKQAIDAIRDADLRFEYALYGMDTLPDRLRKVSEAALGESRAMQLAVLANIDWPGRKTDIHRLGGEVGPDQDRPGPKHLWATVDRAVIDLKKAVEGTSMRGLADAYQELSEATLNLAHALESTATDRETG